MLSGQLILNIVSTFLITVRTQSHSAILAWVRP